jgi:hypothetical protein
MPGPAAVSGKRCHNGTRPGWWLRASLKRGADIPIAVLMSKKRLDVTRLVAGRVPRLAATIERQIRTHF